MVLCRVGNAILPKGNPADATAFPKQLYVLPLRPSLGKRGKACHFST
jgi:hypothetical protein